MSASNSSGPPVPPGSQVPPEPPPPTEPLAGRVGARRDELTNDFSWSPSRARLFGGCRRAYWWRYYGHWGGWDVDAPARARIAYRLGKMDSLDTWAGGIVHDLIEGALKRGRWGRPILAEELRQQARARLRLGWVQSRDGHWRQQPKRALNLVEHYYGSASLDRERTDAVAERVYTALDAFVEGPYPPLVPRIARSGWRSIEALDHIVVAGAVVYVKPDLAFDHPDDGTTWLVDWKTGAPSDKDAFQLATYALFARERWGLPPATVSAVLVYLARGESRPVRIDDASVDAAEQQIIGSIGEMRAALRDPAGNVADPADFPLTEDRHECARCSFRQLCFGAEGVPGAALAGDPEVAPP